MSALLTIAIVGLWAGAVYEPTAIVFLSRQAGMELPEAAKMASYGTGLLSIGTILGCIAAPWLAERLGRRPIWHDGDDRAGIRLGVLPADRLGAAHLSWRPCSSSTYATLRFSAYGCRGYSAPKRAQPPSPSARR